MGASKTPKKRKHEPDLVWVVRIIHDALSKIGISIEKFEVEAGHPGTFAFVIRCTMQRIGGKPDVYM